MTSPILERVDLPHPDAEALIAELNEELSRLYPEEGATHFRLTPDEVAPGRGAFLLARLENRPVGCGGVRLIGPAEAEIKRMYTVPWARGRGVARALLSALEHEARVLGAARLLLETGNRLPNAVRLYERAGFMPIPPFGEYQHSPLSLCMEKRLH